MKEFSYQITDPIGIHARPAGLLVKLAQEFSSAITIATEAKVADAKKLFAVMSLGVKQNTTVIVKIEGDDEDAAIEALQAFFQEQL